MKKYKPIHKRTGREYPLISEEEKASSWAREPYASHFRFEPVEVSAAEAPKEAKKTPVKPEGEEPKPQDGPTPAQG